MSHPFWTNAVRNFDLGRDLNDFKNWPEVRLVPLYIERDQVDGYYHEIKDLLPLSPNEKQWEHVLSLGEPKLGHTDQSLLQAEYIFEKKIRTTGFRLKSIHHALTFEALRQKSILDYDLIIEFGAGIGELAYTIFDLGYMGRYAIVDFPEITKISSFYLDNHSEVYSILDDIKEIPPKTLFIATWSLSETDLLFRENVAPRLKGMDQLIVFQEDFYGINNFDFFVNRWASLTDSFYRMKNIWFHAHQGGSWYWIGRS